MTEPERRTIATDYDAAFSNGGDITHPALMDDDRLYVLMAEAVQRGTPVTEAEVNEKIGDPGWEW